MRLVILGAGGYGRVIGDLAGLNECIDSIVYLDDHSSASDLAGKCTDYQQYINDTTQFYPAFGDNSLRKNWFERLEEAGGVIASMISEDAYVSRSARIGRGTVILPKAVVNTGCIIHSGCIINIGALIDHDCILDDFVHVSCGAIVKSGNHIPAGMKIEAGTLILRNSL